jgi:hypothetical protein
VIPEADIICVNGAYADPHGSISPVAQAVSYGIRERPRMQFGHRGIYLAFVRHKPSFLPSPQIIAKMASSVDAKLMRRTKFPPEFNKKVDMTKVNIEVMKK